MRIRTQPSLPLRSLNYQLACRILVADITKFHVNALDLNAQDQALPDARTHRHCHTIDNAMLHRNRKPKVVERLRFQTHTSPAHAFLLVRLRGGYVCVAEESELPVCARAGKLRVLCTHLHILHSLERPR